MKKNNHIISAYSFDEKGKSLKLSNDEVSKELRNEGLSWVHLDGNNKETKKWLEREANYLDHLIIDALLVEETRPRISEFEHGLLIILRGVNLNKNSEPEDMVSVRIWIDQQRIITIERRNLVALEDLKKSIDSGKSIKSSAEFLYNLIYEILMVTSPFVYNIGEKLDALEEKITTTHDLRFRQELLDIRTKSTIFKRYLGPQKEVLLKLIHSEEKIINHWSRRHFKENLNQITSLLEELDENRDRAKILHDELANSLTEKLNKSIYKISLMTVIFMPLTFITGLFGMNVGGIPGANNHSSFFTYSSVMVLSVAIYFYLFLRKNKKF